MIAINWYEVFLPSNEISVAVEKLPDLTSAPKRIKTTNHRTVFDPETKVLYHITTSPPPNTVLEPIPFKRVRSIKNHIIELGFAIRLKAAGFRVRMKHIGGTAYHDVNWSSYPNIYMATEGINFRGFFGFGEGQPRWGLILSYVVGHYFLVSLADPILQKMSLGKRVVRLNYQQDIEGDAEGEQTDKEAGLISGILESTKGEKAILVDQSGEKHTFLLKDWTLPGRRDYLINFISLKEGQNRADALATRLQQDALTLTPERRINTFLAREQLNRLENLMTKESLFTFRLPLPVEQFARINEKPLVIGA